MNKKYPLFMWLVLVVVFSNGLHAQERPIIKAEVINGSAAYRTVEVSIEAEDIEQKGELFFWLQAPGESQRKLHSKLIFDESQSFENEKRISSNLSTCFENNIPLRRDSNGIQVVTDKTASLVCRITGLEPKQRYSLIISYLKEENEIYIDNIADLQLLTSVEDKSFNPPDTRPVLLMLLSIFLTVVSILVYWRWKDGKLGRENSKLAQLYVAPALVVLAILSFYPVTYGIWLSFTDAHQSHLGDESFVGIANYLEVFGSSGALRVTVFTLIWTICNVSAHVGFGLLLALVLTNSTIKGKLVYRTILLLPWAIPSYISILAWRGIFQPNGMFNQFLGINADLFASALSAQVIVIFVNIWLGIPFIMMSLSGALMSIPKDIYEAANLDGISKARQFFYLTLPSLKSALVPLSLLGFIWTFNMFTTIYLLTQGFPSVGFGEPGATDILITYVYDVAFQQGNYGIAAAWSVMIFVFLLLFSMVYMKKTKATEANA